MFSSLLFLVLTLLIINLAPELESSILTNSPEVALTLGLILYFSTCILITLQNFLFKRPYGGIRESLLIIANIELLAFFSTYHLVLLSHRYYTDGPMGHTILAVISITLYFLALWIFHLSLGSTQSESSSRVRFASKQIRFLFPFAIPFLALQFTFDSLTHFPSPWFQKALQGDVGPGAQLAIIGGTLFTFIVLLMLFLPALIQWFWGCTHLPDSALKSRLDELCQRARFRHAGLRLWTVMNHTITAAIIGIVPRFRYVMFTERLLRQLSPEQIEAVLAHEIGHSYRRHLLIFPFVMLGMVILMGLTNTFFGQTLIEAINLHHLQHPDSSLISLIPLLLFVGIALMAAAYFRLVFGFFSRQFERQADLHVFAVNVHPEHLVGALHTIGMISGGTHHVPNWHHYSIQQRIDFLQAATHNRSLIPAHHRWVKRVLSVYLIILSSFTLVLLSTEFNSFAPMDTIHHVVSNWNDSLRDSVNGNRRYELAQSLFQEYELEGNPGKIIPTIEAVFRDNEVSYIPGVAEFYAAQKLSEAGETTAGIELMTKAWERFDFSVVDPSVIEDFEIVTRLVVEEGLDERQNYDEIEELIRAMSLAKKQQSLHLSP